MKIVIAMQYMAGSTVKTIAVASRINSCQSESFQVLFQ
jgi:hypothetical protein